MLPTPRATRLIRCLLGLVLLGFGLGLTVAADLGLSPWDVLHQGLSKRFDITIGQASIGVGVIVLLGWIPLHERPGIGTVLNVFVIGLVTDLTLVFVDTPDAMWLRITYMVLGAAAWGPGSGLYIGVGLGPGPRDGLMTGLARRGLRVGWVRAGIEVSALVIGWLLGGSVGIGTVFFALVVGPEVGWWLPRLTVPLPAPPPTPPARANLQT